MLRRQEERSGAHSAVSSCLDGARVRPRPLCIRMADLCVWRPPPSDVPFAPSPPPRSWLASNHWRTLLLTGLASPLAGGDSTFLKAGMSGDPGIGLRSGGGRAGFLEASHERGWRIASFDGAVASEVMAHPPRPFLPFGDMCCFRSRCVSVSGLLAGCGVVGPGRESAAMIRRICFKGRSPRRLPSPGEQNCSRGEGECEMLCSPVGGASPVGELVHCALAWQISASGGPLLKISRSPPRFLHAHGSLPTIGEPCGWRA